MRNRARMVQEVTRLISRADEARVGAAQADAERERLEGEAEEAAGLLDVSRQKVVEESRAYADRVAEWVAHARTALGPDCPLLDAVHASVGCETSADAPFADRRCHLTSTPRRGRPLRPYWSRTARNSRGAGTPWRSTSAGSARNSTAWRRRSGTGSNVPILSQRPRTIASPRGRRAVEHLSTGSWTSRTISLRPTEPVWKEHWRPVGSWTRGWARTAFFTIPAPGTPFSGPVPCCRTARLSPRPCARP